MTAKNVFRQMFLKAGLPVVLGVLLTLCFGCGKKDSGEDDTSGSPQGMGLKKNELTVSKKAEEGRKLSHSAFPWLEKGLGADGKPVAGGINVKSAVHKPGEEFNRRYSEGLKKMENEELAPALEVFQEIVKNYPGSEEASMAEYRIAQIHFRNKMNSSALEVYKRIVQEYPNSPIAENARSAITYLETFETHEKNYISPDVDDKKRRGN